MKILSLFSNVGFGEVYLSDLGHEVVVANELLKDRVDFYKKLHPSTKDVVCGDICSQSVQNKILKSCDDHGPIDIIIATPPCQGMSVANAQKESDDIRNRLIVHAMNIFNKVKPKYMLIENVPQMGKTYINYRKKAINIIDFINSKLPNNFSCKYRVLNGKDYGTPQSRKRSICLISKNGSWDFPEPQNSVMSLRSCIGHLSPLSNGEHSGLPWHFCPQHNENHVKWMIATPEGDTAFNNPVHFPQKDGRRIKGFMTTYKRMFWDEPAPTVTMTNGSISSQNNVHPSDPRVLSVRELLLVCGLPENFLDKFSNKLTDGSLSYDYSSNFIRKVIGEIFLPNLCRSLIGSINE